MKSILLTIAYDGTNYAGWQVQANALTIQECMMKAGAEFLAAGFTITTASRTDSGVHAIGQRALLKADTPIRAENIKQAFNSYLPEDIRVWKAEEVAEEFHPRYHAKKKLYVYRFWNGKMEIPALQRNHALVKRKCDPERMNYIAGKFIGRHDFNAFSSSKKKVENTVREIYRCEVIENRDTYVDTAAGRAFEIYVEGNGFLYNMVRIIAGCIIDWSGREISLQEIDERMERAFLTGKRSLSDRTMPAKGLTLLKIEY